jgi:hypothetical protein
VCGNGKLLLDGEGVGAGTIGESNDNLAKDVDGEGSGWVLLLGVGRGGNEDTVVGSRDAGIGGGGIAGTWVSESIHPHQLTL